MTTTDAAWTQLPHRYPDWYRNAPLGIFVHWGPYSVPAWAEPTAELGQIDQDMSWFAHNPYAEWYANTIRIDGSPAQQHHEDLHGGAPYDDFLDAWRAENFDAAAWMRLFKDAGADYVVPTTKHHDGICLWDAPGTGTRNTVHRGPRRDLVGEITRAAKDAGLRVGFYYSGGLDWHARPTPPLTTGQEVNDVLRPKDNEFSGYCAAHVRDLIDRYEPDIFWNDIGWPDDGMHFDEGGLGELLQHFYAVRPEGLVNDRFAGAHHDFHTTEYQVTKEHGTEPWEHCRGIGLSFGYNQREDQAQYLSGAEAVRLLVDVVARSGRLLLNVGPRADGTLNDAQVAVLRELGAFMAIEKQHLAGSEGLGTVEAEGIDFGRAIAKDRVCYVYLSGPESTVTIPAQDLPAGYAWPELGVDVELAGQDAQPTVIRAEHIEGNER